MQIFFLTVIASNKIKLYVKNEFSKEKSDEFYSVVPYEK